jgi:hypothetical protein
MLSARMELDPDSAYTPSLAPRIATLQPMAVCTAWMARRSMAVWLLRCGSGDGGGSTSWLAAPVPAPACTPLRCDGGAQDSTAARAAASAALRLSRGCRVGVATLFPPSHAASRVLHPSSSRCSRPVDGECAKLPLSHRAPS